MLDFLCKESYDLRDFVALITFLRSPDGCPWDQVQTHESIRRNFLEETYEVCEAIDAGDTAHLKEELGDVLMQVLFHTDIERGFIRAEIVNFDDLVRCGSQNAAKEKGLVRLEGKEYEMKDGDVVYFRFNV